MCIATPLKALQIYMGGLAQCSQIPLKQEPTRGQLYSCNEAKVDVVLAIT